MSQVNIKAYDREAADLMRSYNSVTTEEIIPEFAKKVLARRSVGELNALDVGCGSGRDAYWLAKQGFKVIACDGAAEMIKHAEIVNGHPSIRYMIDKAPDLNQTLSLKETFNVVLLNAFIFHFDYREPHNELNTLFGNLRGVCAPQAFVYTNLRHGPVPGGRNMYDIPLDYVESLANSHGFVFEHIGRSADGLGRPDIYWDNIALYTP